MAEAFTWNVENPLALKRFLKKERFKEYKQGWRERNKVKLAAYMRAYRAKHPDYVEKEANKPRLPSHEPKRNH